MELAGGIAHVSYPGGGLFLPARDPYDRQTLMEHVVQRLRSQGRVQVLVDKHRWIVQADAPQAHGVPCPACGQVTDAACYSATTDERGYCLRCALGGATRSEFTQHKEWQQVG